jgi:hypothetical protein
MSNKIVKNNQQETPAPEAKAPETVKPEKKPGIFKRIGNWFRRFKYNHPTLTKVCKVTWGVTKVVAVGALLAKAAYEVFGGSKSYTELPPVDVDYRELPDSEEISDRIEAIGEGDHKQLVGDVINNVAPEMEVVEVNEI